MFPRWSESLRLRRGERQRLGMDAQSFGDYPYPRKVRGVGREKTRRLQTAGCCGRRVPLRCGGARCAFRSLGNPAYRSVSNGFRVVVSPLGFSD